MGALVELAIIRRWSISRQDPRENVQIGGLHSINGIFELLVSNSHAVDTAYRLNVRCTRPASRSTRSWAPPRG